MSDIKHKEKEEVEERIPKIEVTVELNQPKKYRVFVIKLEISKQG
jgi:hypothetical protein